jgi:hypothetical protein
MREDFLHVILRDDASLTSSQPLVQTGHRESFFAQEGML